MIKIIEGIKNIDLDKVLERSQFDFKEVNQVVSFIIEDVKQNKDLALFKYTEKFDKVYLENIKVTKEEISKAYQSIDQLIVSDLKKAMQNIKDYHSLQVIRDYTLEKSNGIILKQRIKPISNVGIYVPGGSAAYPSTVLMNAIPAKIAGVKKIVMITPPDASGQIKDSLLVAADLAGVDEIYKVGGAQGIAALAYGTQTIAKVDKIVGPGNIYVSMAKRLVSGYVGIDMIAGPSEVLIVADQFANPRYIAADLMAQAEHDILACSICLTTSLKVAQEIKIELQKLLPTLARKDIIEKAIIDYGAIIVLESMEEIIKLSNKIAPEHLQLMIEKPFDYIDLFEYAGSIFIGSYTPEPVGDYFAGPNHTLPTSGTARFSSGLSVLDFIVKQSISYYPKEALDQAKDHIIRLAYEEGLTAHAKSIEVRYEEDL